MNEHMKLLGYKVRDKVTGFVGTVTTVGFDLYGCVQAIVNPVVDKDNKTEDSRWFDTKRLEVVGDRPVMPVPTFETVEKIAGPEAKPPMRDLPIR